MVMRVAEVTVHGCPLAMLGEKYTGGMNVYVLHLARELGEMGIPVDVFTMAHGSTEPEVVCLGPNSRLIHIEANDWKESRQGVAPHLSEFLGNLKDYVGSRGLEYQVLHSHYWLSGWVGSMNRRHWSVPHIFSFHTLAAAKMGAWPGAREPGVRMSTERMIAQEADGIISFTKSEQEQLSGLYEVPSRRIEVIPAGVDLGLFRPLSKEKARGSLGLGNVPTVLFVGRADPIKGLEVLLQSIARISTNGIRPQLVVVGGKPDEDPELIRLTGLAGDLGIGGIVKFVGSLPQEDLPVYYSAADVCVLPSYYESFSLVTLEAMACGVPVVASKVGIAQTLIKDGLNGYLVPEHHPDPFAKRLETLLHDTVLRGNMGRSARSSVEGLSWSSMANKVLAFYEKVVAGIEQKIPGGQV